MSEPRGGYQRSFAGLAGAMIMVLLAIAFVWALSRFQHHDPADPAPTVDYTSSLQAARQQAPFGVVAPVPVPAGWRCTSVNFTSSGHEVSWHLGFQTSDHEYVGLEEGNAVARDFIAAKTPATAPGPTVQVDGRSWQTLTSGAGETALVREGSGVTTIVTGTASLADLTAFTQSLK